MSRRGQVEEVAPCQNGSTGTPSVKVMSTKQLKEEGLVPPLTMSKAYARARRELGLDGDEAATA